MSRSYLPLILCAASLLLVAACGEEPIEADGPMTGQCSTGETEPCYTGAAGTEGVGACRGGTRLCEGTGVDAVFGACVGESLPGTEVCNDADDDCDGEADEGLRNACGGCVVLAERRGAPCGNCGTWSCDGTDALRCDEPLEGCGGCGPATPGYGEPCSGTDGCLGSQACQGAALACDAPTKNECGLCGGPAVANLGSGCAGAGACGGTLGCNATNDGSTCVEQATNACGVCATDTQDPGDACVDAGGCAGVWACGAAQGDPMRCNITAPVNACGICAAAGQEPGQPCTNASNCAGTWACGAAAGDPMVCNVPAGSCGGGASGPLLISEVAVAGSVADDEFIELYNPGDTAVDLSTWAIHYKSATGATWSAKRNLTGTIAAKGFFLIGHTGYVGPVVPDMTQATISLSGRGGGNVALTDHQNTLSDATTAIDRVAYGTGDAFEGAGAAGLPAAGASIERKAFAASTDVTMATGGADAAAGNARDSNDNAADFVLRAARDPQNAASAHEP